MVKDGQVRMLIRLMNREKTFETAAAIDQAFQPVRPQGDRVRPIGA